METLIEVSGFDPNLVAAPWYQWTDEQVAVQWALQAVKHTADGLRAAAVETTTWEQFADRLTETFRGEQWRTNAILRTLVHVGTQLDASNPLGLTDRQWLEAGATTAVALASWRQDATGLVSLAEVLGVDPVQCGWVAGEQQATGGEQPEFTKDFRTYVEYYLSADKGLPDVATVGSWFGRNLLPEAIVARFQEDFPTGVTFPNGLTRTIDQIGVFYLGEQAWAATNALDDESLGPEFVQEILAYFSSDEPLDDAQMGRVKKAIDDGVITFEDEE